MIALQANTGMRKSEVTLPESVGVWDRSRINYSSVKWCVGGKYYAYLSPELYAALSARDFCVVTPPPAKADPFCKVWGGRPVYIRYSAEAGINFAYWMAELEMHFPVELAQRENTPLFRGDDGECIKAGVWSTIFGNLLRVFLSAEEAKRYSTHSFRIFLACAAHKAGVPSADIQALCRWRSPESLMAYVRWDPDEYADLVERSMGMEINPLHVANLPHLDPGPLVQALAAMDAE